VSHTRDPNESEEERPAVAEELVFALCHEIGNLIGAVRLHAHLLDDEMTTRELATVSIELDGASARVSAMLSLIRPLLRGLGRGAQQVDPSIVVAGVEDVLQGYGGRGVSMHFSSHPGLPKALIDGEVIGRLLESLGFLALEAAGRGGSISLRAEPSGDEVAFVLEDDGTDLEDPTGWRTQMWRGRPLILAVADRLLGRSDGRIEVERDEDLTRVRLVLPTEK
jgi:signal transduction histidine kinase